MIFNKDKFHSFDALRFISFLIVFFSHLPFEFFPNTFLILFKDRGYVGVHFFFTLSGFLITYILLNEKKESGRINLKKFFMRRILRIWPLYYVMILFAYISPFLITQIGMQYSPEGYSPNFILSCLFLENYQTIYFDEFTNLLPLPVFWSLCVEEHFYIIWGLLLYFTNAKKIPFLIMALLIIPTIARYFFLENELRLLDLSTNIDFFMFGAIPAYLYTTKKQETLNFIQTQSNWLKGLILSTTVIFILFSSHLKIKNFGLIEPVIFGVLFSLVLFIFLPSDNLFKISDRNVISKLGIYTYGLYLTHFIAISFVKKLFQKFNFSFDGHLLIFIGSCLLGAILASYVSFLLIEKPFLKLKKYFY